MDWRWLYNLGLSADIDKQRMASFQVKISTDRLNSILGNRVAKSNDLSSDSRWPVGKLDLIRSSGEIDYDDLVSLAKYFGKSWMYFLFDEEEVIPPKRLNTRSYLNKIVKDEGLVDETIWLSYYEQNLNFLYEGESFPRSIAKGNSHENIASNIRSCLGVDWEDQINQGGDYSTLRYWIGLIENQGAFVVQRKIEHPEVRAYCQLLANGFAVIVLDTEDPKPRLFSLLHEYCHIAVEVNGSFCDTSARQRQNNIERKCNNLASKILLPEPELRTLASKRRGDLEDDDISRAEEAVLWLSNKLGASQQVMLIRLDEIGLLGSNYKQLESRRSVRRPSTRSGPGGDYYASAANRVGKKYAHRAIDLMRGGQLSRPETARLLGVSVYNMGSFMEYINERQK